MRVPHLDTACFEILYLLIALICQIKLMTCKSLELPRQQHQHSHIAQCTLLDLAHLGTGIHVLFVATVPSGIRVISSPLTTGDAPLY